MLRIFSHVSGPSVLLVEVSVQVLCPFLMGLFVFLESWEFFIYFGDQTLVWGIIGKYVFHAVGFLFILMLYSLAMQKLFILIRSHLFTLSFMFLALGDVSVKMLLRGMSEIILPMFSSRTFMVLQLIFKSFIHLEFIVVYGVTRWSSFIFFARSCPDLPTPSVEEAIFAPFYALASFVKYELTVKTGLFLGSLFSSIGLCACFYASTRLFWLQWPCNTVWYQVLWSLLLCSSFSNLLQLFGVIYGSI